MKERKHSFSLSHHKVLRRPVYVQTFDTAKLLGWTFWSIKLSQYVWQLLQEPHHNQSLLQRTSPTHYKFCENLLRNAPVYVSEVNFWVFERQKNYKTYCKPPTRPIPRQTRTIARKRNKETNTRNAHPKSTERAVPKAKNSSIRLRDKSNYYSRAIGVDEASIWREAWFFVFCSSPR